VFEEMLDLYRCIVGEVGEFLVELFDQWDAVTDSVEEVGIAKGDVFGAHLHLLRDVLDDNVSLNDSEFSSVDRDNGAVSAEVLAAACGLGVAYGLPEVWRDLELSVFAEFGQPGSVRREEVLSVERDGFGRISCAG